VSVDQVGVPSPEHGAHAARRGEVPIATHADRGDRYAGGPEPTDERRVGLRDHERFVTVLTLAARQEIHLTLPAAPFSA
jgi:hypothetical protein